MPTTAPELSVPRDGRLEKLTGAPITLEHAGKLYTLSPRTKADLALAKRFLRAYIADEYDKATAILKERGAGQGAFDALHAEFQEAIRNPFASPFFDDYAVGIEFLRLALAHKRPDITWAEVAALSEDPEFSRKAREAMRELNELEDAIRKKSSPSEAPMPPRTTRTTTPAGEPPSPSPSDTTGAPT